MKLKQIRKKKISTSSKNFPSNDKKIHCQVSWVVRLMYAFGELIAPCLFVRILYWKLNLDFFFLNSETFEAWNFIGWVKWARPDQLYSGILNNYQLKNFEARCDTSSNIHTHKNAESERKKNAKHINKMVKWQNKLIKRDLHICGT